MIESKRSVRSESLSQNGTGGEIVITSNYKGHDWPMVYRTYAVSSLHRGGERSENWRIKFIVESFL